MNKSIVGLIITGLVSIALAIIFGLITVLTFCGATGTALANGGAQKAIEWVETQFDDVSSKIDINR